MRNKLLLMMLGFGTVGCTKTVKHDVAVFDLGPGKIYQPAPASGKYAIKIAPPGERDFEKIASTEIRVEGGTVMGFENTPCGIVAFAGSERMSIDVPEGSTVKWQAKTKKHTQLATNLRRAGQYTLWGVGAVAAAALDGAVDEAADRASGSKSSRQTKSRHARDDSGSNIFRDLYRDAAANAAAESARKK